MQKFVDGRSGKLKIRWNPETRRIEVEMPKEEAWALVKQLSKIDLMNPKGHSWIAKEYNRAFCAMLRKDTKKG
jgi:hypothetical protein